MNTERTCTIPLSEYDEMKSGLELLKNENQKLRETFSIKTGFFKNTMYLKKDESFDILVKMNNDLINAIKIERDKTWWDKLLQKIKNN